jgi:predicted ester cyclase
MSPKIIWDVLQKEKGFMPDTSSVDQKVALAREFVTRVFNEHQPERAGEYFTSDVVWHGGSLGTVSGVENVTNLLIGFIGALPDLEAVEQDVVASGDLVVIRLVVSATHKADLLGIPASDLPVQWDAVDIYKVTDDGKISEEWAADDMAAFASQLGALSLPWQG